MEAGKKLILASGSPRRKALLSEAGFSFEILVKPVDENFPEHLKCEQIALFLARKKAAAYSTEISEGAIVLTADTIVCAGDEVLNKPGNASEAARMLGSLSGRSHQVITGVCICDKQSQTCFHVSTTVSFRKLTPGEINYYITHFRPFDKAGAYGIQEWIGLIGIDKIDGSYYNVVGLPIKEVYEHLVAAGFDPVA
jgi:septum formation protein